MTKEELEKEAEGKYIKKSKELASLWNGAVYQEGYKDGAEPREKRIAELEVQIEKMKCCENCNNFMHRIDHRCNTKCKNLSEWEIKEK